MKTAYKQRLPFSANYRRNALLHLVLFTAVCYILLHIMEIVLMVVYPNDTHIVMSDKMLPSLGIMDWQAWLHSPWVICTYFLANVSFWNMVTNMLWLYCFGSVIQSLIGYREIILLYVAGSLLPGILYLIATYAFPQVTSHYYILNTFPGVMAISVAALTLAPTYRYYLGERMAIPIVVVFVVYLLLNVLPFVQGNMGISVLIVLSALTGFAYMRMLQHGSRPGVWLYNRLQQLESTVTPNAEKTAVNNGKLRYKTYQDLRNSKNKPADVDIDAILDKINDKGYDSLNAEEKQALFKASREDF